MKIYEGDLYEGDLKNHSRPHTKKYHKPIQLQGLLDVARFSGYQRYEVILHSCRLLLVHRQDDMIA